MSKPTQENHGSELRLKRVHWLCAHEDYQGAIVILEKAVIEHPDFPLYRKKLDECRALKTRLSANLCNGARIDNGEQIDGRDHPSLQHTTAESHRVLKRINRLTVKGYTVEARYLWWLLAAGIRDSAAGLVALAKMDFVEQRFADALTVARTAIAADPGLRPAYGVAERAALNLGQFEAAKRFFLLQPELVRSTEAKERRKNPKLPRAFALPAVVGAGNEYTHIVERAKEFDATGKPYTQLVSIIVAVSNHKASLERTLPALMHQTYPRRLMQIVLVDTGSNGDLADQITKYELGLKLDYAHLPNRAQGLAAARNTGLKQAKGDSIILMDSGALPPPSYVEAYMRLLHVSDNAVLFGQSQYCVTSTINDDGVLRDKHAVSPLSFGNADRNVAAVTTAGRNASGSRKRIYEVNKNLKSDQWPFEKVDGGNVAFSRNLFDKVGFQDEEFKDSGLGDTEYYYRYYNVGAYFIPMLGTASLRSDPGETESLRCPAENGSSVPSERGSEEALVRKCPAPAIRKTGAKGPFDVPKVSIYIPAHNAERYIATAVQSCLEQDFSDLEVCICDDGSTDGTLRVLQKNYSSNPRVTWISQRNQGIGAATNAAIAMCRGMYIGQLDADDVLKTGAIGVCSDYLDKENIDAVYTDHDFITADGAFVRNAACGGAFAREWMLNKMMVTHFRMFRKRLWARIAGCNTRIANAVDFDLWLKFSEVGYIRHIHEVLYSYRWHGANTSIRDRRIQENNHRRVIADSLERLGLAQKWVIETPGNCFNPRDVRIVSIHANQIRDTGQ